LQIWLENLEVAFTDFGTEMNVLKRLSMTRMVQCLPLLTRMFDLIEFLMQAYRDPPIWEAAIAPYRRYLSYFTCCTRRNPGRARSSHDPEVARVPFRLGWGLSAGFIDPKETKWDEAF
jgi:hypothetical protein